jgi:hypothetical protein
MAGAKLARFSKAAAPAPAPLSRLLAERLEVHRSRSWTFGPLGIYGACSNREEYARLAVARYFAFGALERAFSMQPRASPLARVWLACPELHGAPRKLEYDLRAVGVDGTSSTPSLATATYVASLDETAEDGAALLGHFYGHYLANLVGAPAHGRRAQLALSLAPGTPEICRLPESVEEDRAGYLLTVSTMLDAASNNFSTDEQSRAVEGAGEALDFLEGMHGEDNPSLAARLVCAARVASGYVAEKVRGASVAEGSSDGPMQLLLPHTRRVVTPHA